MSKRILTGSAWLAAFGLRATSDQSHAAIPRKSIMIIIVFGMVLPWLLLALSVWLGYQLVLQNGRILVRLEAIEKRLGPQSQSKPRDSGGLPLGSVAPDFELPGLAGARHKLSEFRGRNVLLVFFNPACGFCTKMAADLAALPLEASDQQALPIVVTTGDLEQNRKLVVQFGIRCLVLRQEQMEVASQYCAQGTPMGYRIDAAGRIASGLAVGGEPLLNLAAAPELYQLMPAANANGAAAHGHESDPSLARSKLNRNGLKAGTAAPDFRLPRIDGGELSLAQFRGRRLLLVFSDPNCGPCDELAPGLQQIHAERGDLQVLMISRRDAEATLAKTNHLGLSFPIVMQKQWEISLLYAKFATPIAYLVDEQGVLLSDVAIGIEPILALAKQPARRDPKSLALTR
jgi:peroxiredoxin